MLSLRTHNILDYVAGILLIAVPFIAGMEDIGAARNVFVALGVGLIGYSLFTAYEISIAKVIPVPTHMVLDVIAGVVLIVAPFVFGYRDALTTGQFAAHIVFGIAPIGLVAMTDYRVARTTVRDTTGTRRPVGQWT